MKTTRRGMTLIEILIACSLLLVFMGASYSLFVRGLRTFRAGDQRTSMLAQVRIAMYTMTREIREGTTLLYPLSSDIAQSTTAYQSSSIAFYAGSTTATPPEAIIFDSTTSTIKRILYDPDSVSNNPYTPSAWLQKETTSIIARNIESLVFSWEDKVPVQNTLSSTFTSTMSDPYAPQIIKFEIKAKDDTEVSGSGMYIWTKVQMRRQ